jgi:hypothetical protein
VATASKWLRRKPSAPVPAGPTATRTAGYAAIAAVMAPASVSAAMLAASQAHTDEELAITVSTRWAPVAGPRASAALASAA